MKSGEMFGSLGVASVRDFSLALLFVRDRASH